MRGGVIKAQSCINRATSHESESITTFSSWFRIRQGQAEIQLAICYRHSQIYLNELGAFFVRVHILRLIFILGRGKVLLILFGFTFKILVAMGHYSLHHGF